MKKALAVLMSLVMVFAFCIPSFADSTEGADGGFDLSQIIEIVSGFIQGIGGGDDPTGTGGSSIDISGIINTIKDFIGGIGGGDTTGSETPVIPSDISETMAPRIISMLQSMGYSKADIQAAIDQLYADGQITEESYNNLQAALDAAEETPTEEAPSIDDAQVTEVAAKIISMLKGMGVKDEQMQGVVDQLFERGVIPENVYNEITNMINEAENTTAASNEGGIGGFLSGIVNTIKGLFGLGGDDSGDGNNNNSSTTNSSDFGAKDPTGDTALISVAAVAAVAGVALVLTKKKQK